MHYYHSVATRLINGRIVAFGKKNIFSGEPMVMWDRLAIFAANSQITKPFLSK
jgi:hypothetical protein